MISISPEKNVLARLCSISLVAMERTFSTSTTTFTSTSAKSVVDEV